MIATLLIGVGTGPVAAQAGEPAAPQTPQSQPATVTLVTGDRVTVDGKLFRFEAAAGRHNVRYTTTTVDGHLYVIPFDSAKLIARGKLDRRLFDVHGLINAGLAGRSASDVRAAWQAGRLGAPIAKTVDEEAYNLTIRNLDPAGRPAVDYAVRVRGLDTEVWQDLYDEDGTIEVRLPRGRYVVQTYLRSGSADHLLVAPGIDLTSDVTVDMDARLSKPFNVTVENSAARQVTAEVGYSRLGGRVPIVGGIGGESLIGLHTAQIGPALPPGELASYVLSRWAIPGADGQFRNSPVTYGLMDRRRGSLFTGFTRSARNGDLAALKARHHAQVVDRTALAGFAALLPEQSSASGYLLPYDQPSTATNYLEPGVEWFAEVDEVAPDAGFASQQFWGSTRTFEAGRTYDEAWNGAVFGPSFHNAWAAVERDGEYLAAEIAVHSDQGGHTGWSMTDSGATRLYRNGELVAESNQAGRLPRGTTVPPEHSWYRLETTAERPSWSTLSTRIDVAWTFQSAVTTESTPLPVRAIRFQPQVDLRNAVKAGPISTLPFVVQAQPGATVGKLGLPEVFASGDDGKTWHAAWVAGNATDGYLAIFPTPRGATHVSLRAKAKDADGNTVDQTIIRAYALTR